MKLLHVIVICKVITWNDLQERLAMHQPPSYIIDYNKHSTILVWRNIKCKYSQVPL